MARVLPSMFTIALVCGGAAPALAHEPAAGMPQPSYQSGYPAAYQGGYQGGVPVPYGGWPQGPSGTLQQGAAPYPQQDDPQYRDMRSEERRVGKEC